jgi:hypothetical protein
MVTFAKVAATVLLIASTAIGQESDTAHGRIAAAVRDATEITIPPDEITTSWTPRDEIRSHELKLANVRFDPTLQTTILELQCVPRSVCVPFIAFSSTRIALNRSSQAVRVRAGDKHPLIAQVGSIRLSRPVIALQSGKSGQSIRVRSLDGKTIMIATVTPSGELVAGGTR